MAIKVVVTENMCQWKWQQSTYTFNDHNNDNNNAGQAIPPIHVCPGVPGIYRTFNFRRNYPKAGSLITSLLPFLPHVQ